MNLCLPGKWRFFSLCIFCPPPLLSHIQSTWWDPWTLFCLYSCHYSYYHVSPTIRAPAIYKLAMFQTHTCSYTRWVLRVGGWMSVCVWVCVCVWWETEIINLNSWTLSWYLLFGKQHRLYNIPSFIPSCALGFFFFLIVVFPCFCFSCYFWIKPALTEYLSTHCIFHTAQT